MPRVLVVEDNADLAYGLQNNLEIEGYEVRVAEDGETGLKRARAWGPDLIILDLMLPDLDGYRVLQHLRKDGIQTPVVILTARGEESDKVLGFRLGADDYVTKPFGVMELLARVEAILRRTQTSAVSGAVDPGDAGERAVFGAITVDARSRIVIRDGEEVSLTPKELDLLLALIRRGGAVASRLDLLKEVWGHRAAVVSRTVDTHIAELRRKLENEPSNPQHILTVHKAGYRFHS
ncbi:MAG: response regulator transcription factor [Gemmatimonadota bacterium]|jgi:DNA-binding response OmpR family regulator